MPPSSVVARSFALAIVGIAAASAAQGQNVTAFNPCSGVGLPGGPVPQYGPQAAYPIVDTVGSGPAFDPWRPASPTPTGMAIGSPVVVTPGPAPAYPVTSTYDPGAYLPPPPPAVAAPLPLPSGSVAAAPRPTPAPSAGSAVAIADRSLRQVQLHAHANGADPESRKVSLARALVVRSYLIDKGVKSRIGIGAFSGAGGDRVDIVVSNS